MTQYLLLLFWVDGTFEQRIILSGNIKQTIDIIRGEYIGTLVGLIYVEVE